MARDLAECSEAEPSDPLSWLSAVPFAAVRLESGKVDPAPTRAEPTALVNSGRSAIYGTTFEYPAETRSVEVIILPIANRADGLFHLVGRSVALESYLLFSGDVNVVVGSKVERPQWSRRLSAMSCQFSILSQKSNHVAEGPRATCALSAVLPSTSNS